MSKGWKGKNNNLVGVDIGNRDSPCILIDGRFIIGTDQDSHSTLIHKVIYGMGSNGEDWESLVDAGMTWRRDGVEDEDVAYGHVFGNNIFWDIRENSTKDILGRLKSSLSKVDDYTHFIVDPESGKYSKIL